MLKISITKAFRGLYRLCQCGCKTFIPCINSRKELASFKHGHSNQKGEKNHTWKGGEWKRKKDGYSFIYAPNHPFCNKNHYVLKHRWVYEQHFNCILLPWVVVHHIIPIKKGGTDNIENLRIFMNNGNHLSFENKYNQFGLIDMSGRKCSDNNCPDPINTLLRKDNGRPCWKTDGKGNILCNICYNRWYRSKNKLFNCSK